MANDVAGTICLARSPKEVGVWIGEVTGLHVLDGKLNGEASVGFDLLAVDRVLELCGG